MKHLPLLLLVVACSTTSISFAQLPWGATAPDWTHTDIDGNTHNLYDLLDQGKMVVIEFSATWCGPCWNYMQTGALETFWEEHGPDGEDDAMVFYIEADQNTTMQDLLGLTPESQGNWVDAIPFPIIDLQWGEDTDEDYWIAYYPTLYAVCSDYKIYEVGQVPASEWAEFIQSCSLDASVADVEDAECFGEGSATIESIGGANPITYEWSNGDNGPVLQGVGAGVYSCTVTEGNGLTIELEDIVINGADAPIGLADSEVEPAACFETATGSVSIQLEEGDLPFDYEWSNGAQTQNLVNVPAGTYSVLATDDNGCTFEASFEVTEPEELIASYEATPEYCGQEDGTVSLDIEGGVGNYDVSASQGDVFGDLIINIPAGLVNIQVEDGNGCIWVENVDIDFVSEPSLYFTPNPLITCIQYTPTVEGYVDPGSGSGDYEFEWSTLNGNIIGPTNQPTIVVDQPGDYDLHVYDLISGCEVESSVAVGTTVDPPDVAAGTDAPISCENLQLVLAGEGAPNNSVSWTTPDGNILSGSDTYTPTVDAPGIYIIEVTNPTNSCSNLDSVLIINELNPASSGFQYQTSGLTMIGTDISTGSNLSGWLWTFGDGNSSTDPNTVHNYATAGTYQVCLSVQNGCGVSEVCQPVEVTFTGSVISVNADIQNVLCFSDSTGSISIQVNGGSGNYTYLWTGPNGETFSTPSIENIFAGVYSLVVSDDQGNIFIGEYSVTEPTPVVLLGSTVVDNLCFGQQNGSITIDIIGGVGPYLYSFNGSPFQVENYISNQSGGNFDGLVQDANGCLLPAGPYVIQEPEIIGNQISISSVRCNGESNGGAALVTSGGVAPYSYSWSFNGSTNPDISQVPAGQYTCLVTDHNGCISEVIADVTQPDILGITNLQVVNASGAQQDNGSISLEVIGGVSPYTVTWSNGATGTFIQGLVPGEYTYVITDTNGCVSATSAPILVNGVVATRDIDWTEFISITPNPSKGNVLIQWEGLEIENGNITLVTLAGKRIQSNVITDGTGTWDLTGLGLTSGVYIVLFEMERQAVPFKLIIL